jgi:alpha-glucosidase
MSSWTGSNLVNSDALVDLELGHRRARAAALLILGLPGAAYLYMGEELGLPEVLDIPDAARQDPIFARTEGREKGRDGCRVPIPWTTDSASLSGFSTSTSVNAWMPQPAGWGSFSVEVQDDDCNSMLALYRQALSFRVDMVKQGEVIEFVGDGTDGLFSFTRGSYAVVVNTSADFVEIPATLVANRSVILESVNGAMTNRDGSKLLAGNTAVWLG